MAPLPEQAHPTQGRQVVFSAFVLVRLMNGVVLQGFFHASLSPVWMRTTCLMAVTKSCFAANLAGAGGFLQVSITRSTNSSSRLWSINLSPWARNQPRIPRHGRLCLPVWLFLAAKPLTSVTVMPTTDGL
jgi:hypothetical protein